MQDSPEILSDAPVSRQMEKGLYGHYGWDPRWGAGNYLGFYPYALATAFEHPAYSAAANTPGAERSGSLSDDGDPHLRSLTAVVGYHIQTEDGPVGHVEDFLVDDANWGLRYLIVDTKNWWPGRHVLVSPYAVDEISWSERAVTLRINREQVKTSRLPSFSPERVG